MNVNVNTSPRPEQSQGEVDNDPETPVFHDCLETLGDRDGQTTYSSRKGGDGEVFSTPAVTTPHVRGSVRNDPECSRDDNNDEELGPLLNNSCSNNSSNNNAPCNSTEGTSRTQRNDQNLAIDHQRQNGDNGSSIPAAIFNFTNSIIGAGCIGLGGAIAMSGGFISIMLIIFFAVLTKASLDLVIRLSIELAQKQHNQQQQQRQQEDVDHDHVQTAPAHDTNATRTPGTTRSSSVISYEDLAQAGMGTLGRLLVLACKFSYSFGCLVAYVIVIKDNCGPALKSLIYGDDGHTSILLETSASERINHWFYVLLSENALFTWTISSVLILPLCMLRDMTPLASASLVSVVSMIMIVAIVIYIYFACPDVRQPGGSFYEKWIEVRPGVLSNLGTFVFTFVSQHTVHLVFTSLKPKLQTVSNWKIVSSWSIFSAAVVSLLVGVFVYMTFWENTQSDIFLIYPHSWMIDTAKLLLCVTMIFTFPLPFFTCRELVIVTMIHPFCGIDTSRRENSDITNNNNNNVTGDAAQNIGGEINSLEQPLLLESINDRSMMTNESDTVSLTSELSRLVLETATPKNWLMPDNERQLLLPGHIGITFKLWLIVTGLAVAAPSLGDILDLVGCASGTLIAFIIPSILSFRLEGYSNLAALIFVVGGAVGTVGTYYSVKQLAIDLGA